MKKQLLAFSLACAASVSSYAGKVSVWGESLGGFSQSSIVNFYASIGHTSVLETGTLDTVNLSGVNLLWVTQPADAYTVAELGAMATYLNSGGRIAFMGEHGGFAPQQNIRINNAISFLGGHVTILNEAPDSGFRTASVGDGQILANSLTAGVNTYEYACFAPLVLSGGAEALMRGEQDSSQIMMAYEVIGNGSIFLITDQNVWDNQAAGWPGGFNNARMFENLVSATVPGLPPPGGAAVPEPSTYGLIGAAALAALVARRRFSKKK
jgi:hypothetical protein